MSDSEIAKGQRAKEASALKYFLCLSLLGSLALHIGVLAFGLRNFLVRTPQIKDEPIEVTIIDTPASKTKPIEADKLEIQKLPVQDSTTPIKPVSLSKTVVAQQPVETIEQPLKQSSTLIQPKETHQPIETKPLQTTLLSKPKASTQEITKKLGASTTLRDNSTTNYSSTFHSGDKQGTSDKLREQLRGIRDIRVTQQIDRSGAGGGSSGASTVLTGSGSGVASNNGITGNGSETGKGNGNGNGIGLGTGNGIGSGRGNGDGKGSTVATAPKTPRIETVPKNPANGESNGRAACRECGTRYPEAARKRGIEGKVEVSVDTDEKGNVTNVRIARSSGHRDLDEDTIRQAREWKLKPASGGRQGVSIATEYAIEGSRRYQALQERKQQREAEARNRQTTTANSDSSEQAPRRKRRLVTTTNADVPSKSTDVPRQQSAPSRQPSRIRTSNDSSVEQTATARQQSRVTSSDSTSTTKRPRREQTSSFDTPNRLQQALRRKRRSQEGTSNRQNKLVDILRRNRERTQPSPTTPNSSATNN
ncbi:MAG: energy transducer TonB [Nostoc sp.]|uniref:energy transducer TonB n=1 Tax=Nostoc sp. TaxID=1180 RepID=UPI002FF75778